MSDFTNKNIMSNDSIEQISDEQLKQFKSDADTWNSVAFDTALDDLRITRNKLLTESDWTQSRDVTLTKDTDWKTYRQSLRDITKGLTTLDDIDKVTWPTKPS